MTPTAAASLVELLVARCDDAFDRPAVIDGSQPAGAMSWGAILAAAVDLAAHVERSGLRRGDRLAHVGPQSIEWIVVDLACLLSGIVHVPLHADESRGVLREQLGWLAAHGIVFSGGRPALTANDLPRSLAVIDLPAIATAPSCDRGRLAARLERHAADCDPDAPAAFFLSSGTTGHAHGVVHCQRALAWNATAASAVFLDDPSDVRLALLPMSHGLARTGDLYTALVRGSCLNLVRDRRRLFDACRAVPPTVILGVPALFERLEQAVRKGAIADLPAALGGRVRVCISGGAPLRERTARAFAAWGLPLVEGYGLAEAGPVVTLANPRSMRPGFVGPALEGVELRIDARPETCGQLLVRTPGRAVENVPAGGDLDGRSPLAADGWLETGDLAEIDADGQVRITGRIADGIVLATGQKIPPAEVERALAEDPAVAQACVLGDGLRWPVALIVPEPHVLRAAIRRMKLRVWSREQALRHPRVLAWLARRLARRQARLPRGWRVRRAALVGRPFEASRGEATASLKLKRRAIAANFRSVLDAAAQQQPPAWLATIPVGHASGAPPQERLVRAAASLASCLWHSHVDGGGFASSGSTAAAPLRDSVAAILERAEAAIAGLRAADALYDPPTEASRLPAPPIPDAPPRQQGIFSAEAERALGETGFWGLAVPESFGGAGCTMQELATSITRMAANVPTAAGMLSVHSSIGAVAAVAAFGSPGQQARHLPGLARGLPLSIFAATEPDAGCDLSAVAATFERRGDSLLITGTKMFITGATHGRLVKLLAMLDGQPAVALVRLPAADDATFRLRRYPLHPLKHAHNAALEFHGFKVDPADLLAPPADRHGRPDAMKIIWHGLNRGRITLAAQAAGTLRILFAQARDFAGSRRTWGEPIGARQLVQGRLGRIAARTLACDALAAWAAGCIDAGETGELEAITAKIMAGECVRESAIDALGVHGGRAFLVGHPLGDSFHDHLAVTVYEGESDLLGLALFKGLVKHHPLASLARDATASRRAAAWLGWRIGRFARGPRPDVAILDATLRSHAAQARRSLDRVALRIDRAVRRHGRQLAERQLEIGSLSAEVRELVSVVAVAHYADAAGDDGLALAADCWCRLALARAHGRRLTEADHALVAELGCTTALDAEESVGGTRKSR
ncbi:MAG: AMP-binding protein [Planctomycetia bacterium]